MRYHFETTQWLPYPPELVFAFFANPENLPRLMPRWQRARIEEAVFTAPPPRPTGSPRYPGIAAGNGTRLTIGIRPFPFAPFRIPWEAEIEDFLWNQSFCDTQLRGPFTYWRHYHTVTAGNNPDTPTNQGAPGPDSRTRDVATEPGTLLRDEIDYELPLGPLNSLANRLIAKHTLAYTFRYRQRRTTELLALATGRK